MPARISVEVDGPTARLSALARAASAHGSLAATSAKSLSGLVRAVRLYAEARERELALAALGDVRAFARELESAGEEPALAAALKRHADALVRPLARL